MAFVYPSSPEKRRKLLVRIGVIAVALLIVAGVFAKNDWFPRTDAFSGQKYGWFGKKLPKNAENAWSFFPPTPTPTPTPQLSKEYIYAGSRLLAVEDANASAVPPADLAVWRPSNGNWYVLGGPGSAQTTQTWGVSGDIPVPGDFDGDGKTDFAIYRPDAPSAGLGKWYFIYSSTNSIDSVQYGATGDKPAQADYDGDGKTDRALWRPSNQTWYFTYSSTSGTASTAYGSSGDTPAAADYDGDGKADIGVYRSSNTNFYSVNSSDSQSCTIDFSSGGTDVVSSDYDGDGKADYAIFDSTTTPYTTWRIRLSSTGTTSTTTFGVAGDKVVQNDYDGDGKCDIAVWRPSNGNWYILQSHDSQMRTFQWGVSGDIPVPAYFRR
jgi:hypothetical protein